MKLTTPKINNRGLLKAGLQILVLLLVAYEAYLLWGIYRSLNQNSTDFVTSGRSTINQTDFKKAADRYTATFDFQPGTDTIPNPFVLPPKPSQ